MNNMYSVLSNVFDKEVVNIEFYQFNSLIGRVFTNDSLFINPTEPSYKIYFSDNTAEEIKLSEYIFKLIEYALAWKNTQS